MGCSDFRLITIPSSLKKISLVVLLIALFPNAGFTQSLSLSGQVTDQQERPLQFAHVHINKQFSLTDEQGSYHFDKLDQGELQIRVSYVGFISLDTIVSLTETRQLNFQLREDAASLETVLLEHTRQRSRPENIQRVSSDYLQQQFTGSLASSLEKLPGMSAMEIGAGASKPIIRGLGFNRVAVTENGIKQEGQHQRSVPVRPVVNVLPQSHTGEYLPDGRPHRNTGALPAAARLRRGSSPAQG